MTNDLENIKKAFFLLKICRAACPIAEVTGRETYTPSFILRTIYYLKTKQLNATADNLKPLYMCMLCGRCTNYCEGVLQFQDIIEDARLEIGTEIESLIDKEALNTVEKDILENYTTRLSNFTKNGNGDTIVYIGYNYSHHPELIKNILELLEKTIGEFDVLGEKEPYCGTIYYDLGIKEKAIKHSQKTLETLNQYKNVIILDPDSLKTIKHRYPKHGLTPKPKIYHYLEILTNHIEKIKARTEIEPDTTYIDPCELVQLNIIEQPRKILEKTGIKIRELQYTKKTTYPTGSCGSFHLINKEIANQITQKRYEEIKETNIKTIITTHPKIIKNLKKYNDIKTYDLSQIIQIE